MKRTVFLLSILLIAAFASHARAARKIFIRDIVLHGSCVKEVSVEALRALLAQEMPRDILAHRGLAYEDPSPYLDVSAWNAESFTVREARNIMRRVRQFDMKMMLWLEASCLPGVDARPAYVLTGHLMDLDRMDEILSCQDARASRDRRICHGGGDVYDAVTFAHAEMDSFAAFVPAVRHLLARLLRIPEIEVRLDSAAEVFAPGQIINLHFSVRRNDQGHALPLRYIQEIVLLPADQRQHICADPAHYFEQHRCGDESGQDGCLQAVPFEVVSRVGKRLPATGGQLIRLRPPPHEADYLVRAEVVASEGSGEIHSTPTYRCIQVRERNLQAAMSLRIGTPLPNSFPNGITVGPLVFGIDLSIASVAIRSREQRPGLALAALLGVTYAGGGTCIPPPMGGACYSRYSRSFSIEARGQLRFDILRARSLTFGLVADLGVALEALSTVGSFSDDGAHALLLGGLGLTAGGQFGLSPRWDLGWTAGILYQWRFRITESSPTPESIEFSQDGPSSPDTLRITLGPGIPTLWQPLWFTLGLRLASPLRPPE